MVDSISSIGNTSFTFLHDTSGTEVMDTEQLQQLLKSLLSQLRSQGDSNYQSDYTNINSSLSDFMNSYFPNGGEDIASYLTADLTPDQRRELTSNLQGVAMPDAEQMFSDLSSGDANTRRAALESESQAIDDGSAGFSHLPPNSIVRQFTDSLFGANKTAENKVKDKMDFLDRSNKLAASNDKEAIKEFLRENGYDSKSLDGMDLTQLKEALDGFTETMQIKLQQDMAILQVTFQTISSIVDNLKQATGKPAGG
ncbi:MAG: hypothetical protein P8077_05285 [Gammaproteobacteria bacterium]